jgi:hypothetical protein
MENETGAPELSKLGVVLGEPALEVFLQLVELASQRVPYFDN